MGDKRHKVIGNPLRKFKQAPKSTDIDPFRKDEKRPVISLVQEATDKQREFFEEWMETDARLGLPFMSSGVTSERTGVPDEWWFRKAKELGRVFDDHEEFWKKERAECKLHEGEYQQAYLNDQDAAEFFIKWANPGTTQPFEDPNWMFDYTWEKCKAGLQALPNHETVPSAHKGTYFAMSAVARAPEMVLGAYIKCGIPIVQDIVAEYLMSMSGRLSNQQRPKDWQEQVRILLREANWEEVETVLKEGERAYSSKNMHNILKRYRNAKTPGDYYKRIMNP